MLRSMPERCAAPLDMGVKVDQAGRDDVSDTSIPSGRSPRRVVRVPATLRRKADVRDVSNAVTES